MNYMHPLASSRDIQTQHQKTVHSFIHQLLLLYMTTLRMIVAESLKMLIVSTVGECGPPKH